MNRNWPIEALKAQAVAARSYALYKMRLRKQKNSDQTYYDLESSEKDQVNGSLSDINSNTIKATSLTEGEVLLNDQKKLDPIFYHAQCGGQTLLPQDVWHENVSNYKKVKCSFCQTTSEGIWKRDLSLNFFLSAIKQKSRKLVKIDDKSKYSEKLRFYFSDGMLEIEKEEFRRLFGKSLIRSNRFSVALTNQRIVIQGQGLGHGVGLCQLGALDLAKKGLNYKQILKYYYPRYELSKVNGKTFDQL
jgi:stage II sporulation protein D